jgi:NADPH2:quinone reductase
VRAALITELGRSPQVGEAPEPGDGALEVLAAAVNPVDRAIAAGTFYGGHPPLPYVPGSECVGRRADGRLVWSSGGGLGLSRNGAIAERSGLGAVVADVPEGADPVVAAALGIAGLSGWLTVTRRAPVRPDDRVLVLGATGATGQVAVQAAKLLGAAHVTAAGRDRARLERALQLGADEIVELDGDLGEPTYVFDPLWSEPLERAVAAAAARARIVHLGQSAGPTATLTSAAVRSKELELYGFSIFATPAEVLAEEFGRLVRHAIAGEIRLDVEQIPLAEIEGAWNRPGKLVVVP